jgi:hypothetical protein
VAPNAARELLARFLLSGEDGSQAAGKEIFRLGQWKPVVSQAARWGVLPQLGRRLSSRGIAIPAGAQEELRTLSTAAFVRSALLARKGVEVMSLFQSLEIPAVAFKGLAAMALLYGGPQHRIILDVDILTPEEQVAPALSALRWLGFRPIVAGELADYAAFVRRSPGFGGNEAITLCDDWGCAIDLHWSLGAGFGAPDLLSRSQVAGLLGGCVRVVCPEDGLLLCAHHTLRNNFSPDKSFRDLLDIEAWCDLLARRGKLEGALQRAVACGLSIPLLALARLLTRLSSNVTTAEAVSHLEPLMSPDERGAVARLVPLFLLQVRQGAFNSDLVYFLRARDLRRILVGLISGRRHGPLMRQMEAALEGASRPLPRRFQALVRSLAAVRLSHLRMLRTLAAAKNRCEQQSGR